MVTKRGASQWPCYKPWAWCLVSSATHFRPGVLGKEGSAMSRIEPSLWEVLNVKSLGHRRWVTPTYKMDIGKIGIKKINEK